MLSPHVLPILKILHLIGRSVIFVPITLWNKLASPPTPPSKKSCLHAILAQSAGYKDPVLLLPSTAFNIAFKGLKVHPALKSLERSLVLVVVPIFLACLGS